MSRLVFAKQRLTRAEHCYVTCPGYRDGVGAQLHARLSTMLYAERLGLCYAHTPFSILAHAPKTDPHWPAKWERFLGLGVGETAAFEIARQLGPPRPVTNPTQIRVAENTFWSVPNAHLYANLFPRGYERLTAGWAARYAAAPKDGCVAHYTEGAINVAVHMRRGDVTSERNACRYTADDYIATLLDQVTAVLRGSGVRSVVRMFSQGEEQDFASLRRFDLEFHLEEDLFTTFHSLVQADVLVMAKSCFSCSAALLARGIKIYEPTGHQPLAGWVVADVSGRIDKGRLSRALFQQRAAR